MLDRKKPIKVGNVTFTPIVEGDKPLWRATIGGKFTDEFILEFLKLKPALDRSKPISIGKITFTPIVENKKELWKAGNGGKFTNEFLVELLA